jgi:hypothetical protein
LFFVTTVFFDMAFRKNLLSLKKSQTASLDSQASASSVTRGKARRAALRKKKAAAAGGAIAATAAVGVAVALATREASSSTAPGASAAPSEELVEVQSEPQAQVPAVDEGDAPVETPETIAQEEDHEEEEVHEEDPEDVVPPPIEEDVEDNTEEGESDEETEEDAEDVVIDEEDVEDNTEEVEADEEEVPSEDPAEVGPIWHKSTLDDGLAVCTRPGDELFHYLGNGPGWEDLADWWFSSPEIAQFGVQVAFAGLPIALYGAWAFSGGTWALSQRLASQANELADNSPVGQAWNWLAQSWNSLPNGMVNNYEEDERETLRKLNLTRADKVNYEKSGESAQFEADFEESIAKAQDDLQDWKAEEPAVPAEGDDDIIAKGAHDAWKEQDKKLQGVVDERVKLRDELQSNLDDDSGLYHFIGDFFSFEENLSDTALFQFLLPEKSLAQAWEDNFDLGTLWSETYQAKYDEGDSRVWATMKATYAIWEEFSFFGW